ncbi:unnamed protein product [Rotaria magnacalcarata]|uniref:Mitochondrial cytochrome c oxidase subunit VIc/VIIs domain-containing protein n=1 Tax=Rotaria magnacalcarata TaxID=392030 RepID=A0A816SV05_9BILA|nr:unnamed protein product [Rotaria magnacalcarata]CAF1675428.1 unnamed protein product [Rotaria magnacalcarata]CAF2092681.1 unnamed protein product [Rotaria magnacalcarata]CAF5120106.1 unnamed protein product [Rotaria magnacalcarata]
MSATVAGRPVLKNLTRARVPKAGIIGFSIAVLAAVVVKHYVCDKHKYDMKNFYNNFDPERDYARMKASGVFKSLASVERPAWLSEYETELDQAIATLQSSK